MKIENKIDQILDDLAQCTGRGKWDKHYLEVVEEVRKELITLYKKDSEDYDMLVRENDAFAEAFKRLGYTDDQISDIANGKKYEKSKKN